MKLLIADDQMSLHRFLDKMINWDYLGILEIQHAYNGKEAADLAASFKPDLLIIDIQMPMLDGIEALKLMQQSGNKPKTIILSAYDQFEYARKALRLSVSQYLLKPVDAPLLETVLKEMIKEYQEDIQEAITSQLDRIVLPEKLATLCLPIIHDGFKALGIRNFLAITLLGDFRTHSLFKEALFSEGGVFLYSFLFDISIEEHVIVIGLKTDASHLEIRHLCVRQLDLWKKHVLNDALVMGLSQMGNEVETLPVRINESRSAAKMSFYINNPIYEYCECVLLEEDYQHELHRLGQKFEAQISTSYTAKAVEDTVCRMFTLFREKRIDPERVRQFCSHLLFTLVQSVGKAAQAGEEETLLKVILSEFKHIDALEMYFKSKLAETTDNSCTGFSKLTVIIRKIKQYIETQYSGDLSLQTISYMFSIDKYQLSRAFKQEFRINYWTYVTQVRMEKAVDFLTNTEWKNSHIAYKTGFLDESHFSRAFKKYYGIAPKEYRMTHEGND